MLKALAAVDKAATDVCQLFDKNITRVYTNLGWEQEYFLVDSALYNARPDLCLTGRTLMGHSSAKDQQLEDHYFGSIPPRVTAFMKELEIECHKLGIPAKTRHNEVAPNQFELAPIFESLKGNFSGSINVLTDLDATMSPVLDTMQGDGSLSTRDLSLSGVKAIDQIADAMKQQSLKEMKVKDMTLDFTIKDGRVETQPFDIKMGDYLSLIHI